MAELLAANQITIAKVLDGEKGADGEMSAEQLAQLNQASADASQAKSDASTAKTTAENADSTASAAKDSVDTLSDKTRSGFIETLSGTGFVQSNKTEDGGTSEVVVYGKSVQDGTPTPDAPVEIQSVENPKVMACGTNVFDAEAFYQHYYAFKQDIYKVTVDGVECLKFSGSSGYGSQGYHRFPLNLKPNTQYLISFRGKKESVYGHNSTGITVNYSDGSSSNLFCADTTTFTDVVMLSSANKTITSLNIAYAYYEYCYLDINSICIREVGTEFEPYTGKTVTLSDIALRSTPGGTRDKLFKEVDGLWKIERKYGVVDLGSLTWYYDGGATRFYAPFPQIKLSASDSTKPNVLCSLYSTDTPAGTWNNRDKVISSNTGQHMILVRDTAYTDAATFKAAMSGVIVVYELETPIYEILSDSIQSELNALTTYNPVTNVIVSDGVTPDFDVSFWTRDYATKQLAGNAQTGVDALNDSVYGVQTFEYILDGVTITAHKRTDGTYYYILNDAEVDVAESDLVHDADGELVTYHDGGIYESLDNMSENIGAIGTKVNSFDARETAIYNAIQDNSLIARKNARVEGNSLIITNDTATEAIANLLNYLQLNADSIVIYGNGKDIVTIAKTADDSGYMKMNGTSMLQAQESRLSTIRLRSADGTGNLAFVAGSDGHVSLKEVLN